MLIQDLDLISELFLPSYEGFLLVDSKSQKILVSNPSIESMLGFSKEELAHISFSEIIPQNGLFLRMIETIGEEKPKQKKKIYWQMKKKNGELLNIDFVFSIIRLQNEEKDHALAVYVEDRSSVSNLEFRINLIQSIFQAVREIKIAIEFEKPLAEILSVTCQSLQKARKFQAVWCSTIDSKEKVTFHFSDTPKLPDFPIIAKDFFEFTKEPIPMKEMYSSEKGSFFSYSHESEKYKTWCNFLNPGGIVNALCIPIVWGNSVYGAIEIISFAENPFIEEDIAMLAEIGVDIGFANHSRIHEEERQLVLRQLGFQIQLLDSIAIPVYSLNQMGKINYANSNGLSLLNLDFSKAQDVNLFEHFGLSKQEEERAFTEPSRIEIQVNKSSINPFPAIMQSFVIRDEFGEFLGVMVILFNLTEIRNAELQIRKSEANLRNIFATMNYGIVIVDRNGIVLDIAPIFKFLLFQINPIEPGEFLFSFLPKAIQEEFLKDLKQVTSFENARSKDFSIELIGEEKFYTVRFLPMRQDSEFSDATMLIFSEVTENILINRQLTESMKFASLGEIAAGIAHEINNPLQSALLNLDELINDGVPDPTEHKHFLKKIESANLRIRDLVKSLLDLGRIESPKKDYVSPYFILVRTSELMELSCKKKGIIYSRTAEPNLPGIFVRWQEIEQVLINCIVNAVNAISEMSPKSETPRIEVGVSLQRFANKPWVVFAVSDNGPGMDEATLKKAFLPLFTTRREKQGTGLGLSISKKIISDHEGTIEIKSKLGEGTQIEIFLPATEPDADNISN